MVLVLPTDPVIPTTGVPRIFRYSSAIFRSASCVSVTSIQNLGIVPSGAMPRPPAALSNPAGRISADAAAAFPASADAAAVFSAPAIAMAGFPASAGTAAVFPAPACVVPASMCSSPVSFSGFPWIDFTNRSRLASFGFSFHSDICETPVSTAWAAWIAASEISSSFVRSRSESTQTAPWSKTCAMNLCPSTRSP